MSAAIDKLFDYDNFRTFLKDYFEEQKRMRAVFSHRFFAAKAGFSSSSYCLNVLAAGSIHAEVHRENGEGDGPRQPPARLFRCARGIQSGEAPRGTGRGLESGRADPHAE